MCSGLHCSIYCMYHKVSCQNIHDLPLLICFPWPCWNCVCVCVCQTPWPPHKDYISVWTVSEKPFFFLSPTTQNSTNLSVVWTHCTLHLHVEWDDRIREPLIRATVYRIIFIKPCPLKAQTINSSVKLKPQGYLSTAVSRWFIHVFNENVNECFCIVKINIDCCFISFLIEYLCTESAGWHFIIIIINKWYIYSLLNFS